MAQTKNPDLVLSVACQEKATRTWVLEPKGRNSFRIVVRCRRALDPYRNPRSWFSYFRAIIKAMLPVFALWRHRTLITGFRVALPGHLRLLSAGAV